MKKATCYGSLPANTSHQEWLQVHKDAGFDGVEIRQFETLEEAEKVAGLAQDIELEIHSVMGGTHWQQKSSSATKMVSKLPP